jgi:peptidyl-prolyl cis-trans isomerase SurA
MTKKLLTILLACLAAAYFLPMAHAAEQSRKAPEVIDRIVAVVNDEVITRVELEERLKVAVKQLQKQGTPLPPEDVIRRQLLERMITDRVQLQFAKETGLKVDDADLDRAVSRIADDNKLSVNQLQQVLARDGVPYPRFRDDVRNEIILARLREREVENKIVVAESEVDNFLTTHQNQGQHPEEYNISHILISVPEQASPEQIQARRQRAEEVLARLKSGADFRQVAAAYSDAPDALQGGSLGWREGERLPTIFFDAVKDLKPGELTAVLRSSNGFHVLKLNDKRNSEAPLMVQQTHARHILIKTNEVVSEAEAQSRLRALKERLDHGADFAELARVHSEDASASKGGDLGWLSPGDTVPEFERAMDALKPGEISEPVKTQFGWHLIQVLARRNQDMSKERMRLMARQALRARKSDEAYQEWVRQLRDRAYVDIRLGERR